MLLPLIINKFQYKLLMEMDLMFKYYIWISIQWVLSNLSVINWILVNELYMNVQM